MSTTSTLCCPDFPAVLRNETTEHYVLIHVDLSKKKVELKLQSLFIYINVDKCLMRHLDSRIQCNYIIILSY